MARLDYEGMVREHYERYTRPRHFVVKSRVKPSFLDHSSYNPSHDYSGYDRMREAWKTAFPDHKVTCDQLICSRTFTVALLTMTGTHQGEFMGIPPTGKTMKISAVDIIRYHRGKPVEHWGEMDYLGLLQQLGATKIPEKHSLP